MSHFWAHLRGLHDGVRVSPLLARVLTRWPVQVRLRLDDKRHRR